MQLNPPLISHLTCPVCDASLTALAQAKSVQCKNGHLFDYAKSGYLNLLLSHLKKSKAPGDTKQMVNARSQFLDAGHYQQLADELISIALARKPTQQQDQFNYLDIACGEGYYTTKLHQAYQHKFSNSVTRLCSSGVDISQPAILVASKRSRELQWLIATAIDLPIERNSQDLVSSLFCRVDFNQAATVLKPGGTFIVATSGSEHLIELRRLLYKNIKTDKPKDNTLPSNLHLVEQVKHQSSCIVASQTMLKNLLLMTPHYWRSNEQAKQALLELEHLELTLQVTFDVFQKKATVQ